ncbi:MAG: methionyl-tRNA formyltransferase [Pseudonocardiales bacterium]|uniref:methionyl-tRNA formyltransferase n=1 Tax=Pseudonocardia sp. Cha107L01 TaxID=3457576 RepID=UPI0028C7035C|nr:methionyl-tRNA formyltransferase [Pseudonocardiales bacterium]MDT7566520.1 methionyl-tRNA formyltransferase [Pseudonocardiales bacterium]MDT7584872.1 methionyl-tRNA formyltransferase [Pseudonocardiales bacterium]MDT7607808.1 methionyl-tRNA formyltransferase [Pseudonocardiales bacterium]MDT7627081.1 methionyl-tRNA formyltransferase [Pseudonocardiales bacterium]
MRLVFAGTPTAALPALSALLGSPRHEVVAVLTRPDAPTGRGRRLAPSPVAELAAAHDVPVLRPPKPSAPDFVASLAAYRPDCCPVVAYGSLLRPALLAVPRYGWVNLHFSVLPAWRGAAPVQAAVRHGDEVTGASCFRLEEGMDTGPVYGVVTESIGPRDTSGDLLDRLARSGAELLLATLDGIEDGLLRPVPQPAEGVSYAPKVTVADAEVDWRAPATAVDRLIRSVTPEPGAWTTFRAERLGLGPAHPVEHTGLLPGELRVEKRRVLVGSAAGAVELGTVRAAGKREMPASDWARGIRPEPGERFVAASSGLTEVRA